MMVVVRVVVVGVCMVVVGVVGVCMVVATGFVVVMRCIHK